VIRSLRFENASGARYLLRRWGGCKRPVRASSRSGVARPSRDLASGKHAAPMPASKVAPSRWGGLANTAGCPLGHATGSPRRQPQLRALPHLRPRPAPHSLRAQEPELAARRSQARDGGPTGGGSRAEILVLAGGACLKVLGSGCLGAGRWLQLACKLRTVVAAPWHFGCPGPGLPSFVCCWALGCPGLPRCRLFFALRQPASAGAPMRLFCPCLWPCCWPGHLPLGMARRDGVAGEPGWVWQARASSWSADRTVNRLLQSLVLAIGRSRHACCCVRRLLLAQPPAGCGMALACLALAPWAALGGRWFGGGAPI